MPALHSPFSGLPLGLGMDLEVTRMSANRFFVGFLATLKSLGENAISTASDEHHARFDSAVSWMRKAIVNGYAGVLQPSVLFFPNPVSGRYSILDSALFRLT